MTELLFKLSIWELKQIANHQSLGSGFLKERIHRINNYFRVLTQSFSIMTEGLDPDQFLKFRMALVPASGFQSVQYRMLEIACTPLQNLVHQDHRERLKNASIEEQFAEIYWKRGAIVANTGEKTLTLKRFEDQYDDFLIKWAKDWQGTTLWERYQSMLEAEKDESMLKQMRTMDKYINIHWPKAHFQTAKRYLEHGSSDDEGTGGTNYKEYLPPKIQKRIFFPDLWTEEERANWGRT
jgi:tryptophan 2,3-dioxygenase